MTWAFLNLRAYGEWGWGDGEETEWKGKWGGRCEWRAVNKTATHVDEAQRTHVWRMELDVKYS